jgi:uncharacterized protein YjbJ (UPF0337 family)
MHARVHVIQIRAEDLPSIRRRKEPTMRSKGRDKAGGTLDKVRGRIREASGALTGSDRSRAKGQARQGRGETRKKRGHLRDLFRK